MNSVNVSIPLESSFVTVPIPSLDGSSSLADAHTIFSVAALSPVVN